MLQINSGKLYSRGVGRTNQLRGVLYSNLELRTDLVTAAGILRKTDRARGTNAIVYEIEERIEAAEVGPGVLVSHTIAPFLADFSALATFGLRAIVAPDPDTVARMVSDEPGLASYDPPRKFARGYFDQRVLFDDEDANRFAEFVDQLLALERKSFLKAMRAIRTFVAGLYRLRDDLALAYTLLVSAGESLAQAFDGYETAWRDVDERRRKPIEAAIARASPRTAEQVKAAVLASEHGSLARRYRAFMLTHIGPAYFRTPQLTNGSGVARHELGEAVRQAYVLRSRYVHNLRTLPDEIRMSGSGSEVAQVDRRPTLTFAGLVRLTDHAIRCFVESAPKIAVEPYDYIRETPGVATVQLSAEYWVGRPLRSPKEARQRLEGHLEQLLPVLCNTSGASVTDLRPIFGDIERLSRSSGSASRTTLLTLYALFAALLPKGDRSKSLDAMLKQHANEIGAPGSEAVIARTILGLLDAWSIEEHEAALEKYFESRSTPSGLRAPRLLDAALCAALAERYRSAKMHNRAREWLARGVEAFPGHAGPVELENVFSPRRRIPWQATLLSRPNSKQRSRSSKRTLG